MSWDWTVGEVLGGREEVRKVVFWQSRGRDTYLGANKETSSETTQGKRELWEIKLEE